jgi:hypothetical protein
MNNSRIAVTIILVALAPRALAQTAPDELAEHPRIARAISELEDAIRYMQAAPHDFGGHKANAIQASENAIRELRLAMSYRQAADAETGIARTRAKAAWEALVAHYGPQVFEEREPGRFPRDTFAQSFDADGTPVPATVWAHSQIARAAMDLAAVTGGDLGPGSWTARTLTTLDAYRLVKDGTVGYTPGVKHAPDAVRWWDDNGWVALVLLQAHALMHGRSPYLERAQALWPFLRSGHVPGFAQRENESKESGRGFSSGAAGADDDAVGLLYLYTDDAEQRREYYDGFLVPNDGFLKTTMAAPGGLYWDEYYIDVQQSPFKWCTEKSGDGKTCASGWLACNSNRADLPPPPAPPPPNNVCAWVWGTRAGLMIGSDLRRYRILGPDQGRPYLESAIATARGALARWSGDWLWRAEPVNNLALFANLLALDYYAPDPGYRAALRQYLDRVWSDARDPATGLFNKTGSQIGDERNFTSMDQAAFVILYTLVAWPHDDLPNLY